MRKGLTDGRDPGRVTRRAIEHALPDLGRLVAAAILFGGHADIETRFELGRVARQRLVECGLGFRGDNAVRRRDQRLTEIGLTLRRFAVELEGAASRL